MLATTGELDHDSAVARAAAAATDPPPVDAPLPDWLLRDPWPAPAGKKARTRRRILLAAGEIFSTKSVERASVDEIAELAGVSIGSLYKHFGSKELLAVAYLDGIFDLLDADLAALDDEPSPIRRVLGAGDVYVQHVIDYPAASRMASIRAAYPSAEHQGEAANALDRRMVKTLMGVASNLKSAMDQGEIPTRPVDEAMVFVWSAWHGVAVSVARCDYLTVPPEIARRALAFGREVLLGQLASGPED